MHCRRTALYQMKLVAPFVVGGFRPAMWVTHSVELAQELGGRREYVSAFRVSMASGTRRWAEATSMSDVTLVFPRSGEHLS
jgi:hypothetical protein